MWTLKSSLSLIDSWEGIKRWKTKVMELMEPVGVPYLRRSPSVRVRLGIKRGVIESAQHQPCPGRVMLSRLCLWGFCHVFSLHCQPHRTPVPPPSSWTYTAWPSPCNISDRGTSEVWRFWPPKTQYSTSFPALTLPGGLSVPRARLCAVFCRESSSPSFQ